MLIVATCMKLLTYLSRRSEKITWNNMITGYARVGEMEKAVKIFEKMERKI